MELFLNDSHESFLLELLVSLLGHDAKGSILPIKLSKTAFKLYEAGAFKLPNVPCLITEQETILTTSVSISLYLIDLAFCEEILLGGSNEKKSEIISIFEIIQRKKTEEILLNYNNHLLTRSFIFLNHLTLGDLVLFCYIYDVLYSMNDSDKLKNNNIIRWYLHIQSLENVAAFLKKNNKCVLELPENLVEENKKIKK